MLRIVQISQDTWFSEFSMTDHREDRIPVFIKRPSICLKQISLVLRCVIYPVISIMLLVLTLQGKVVLRLLTIPHSKLSLSKCLRLFSYFPYIPQHRCFENLNCFDVKKSKFIFWIIYSTICKLNICTTDWSWQVYIFIAPRKESTWLYGKGENSVMSRTNFQVCATKYTNYQQREINFQQFVFLF